MVIRVIDIVPGADTGTQGNRVYLCLKACLAQNPSVTISFEGVEIATSSFVNAAFVQMLDNITFDDFKRRVKIVRSGKQIIEMIKARMLQESAKVAA